MSETLPPALVIRHNVVEHLGIKLYKNKLSNVLAELIANGWDADAEAVNITTGTSPSMWLAIDDTGSGMSYLDIVNKYLQIGLPKRKKPTDKSDKKGRPPMGRKGLGKLAPFGVARIVDVISVKGNAVTWLTLNLDDIMKIGNGRYEPTFHLEDASFPEVEDKSIAKEFLDFLDDKEADSGTRVYLSSLTINELPETVELMKELGGRFTVTLLNKDFDVYVNSKVLDEEFSFPKFEFRIPKGTDWQTVTLSNGKKASFWVGFVKSAEWPSDQAGVGVFAHGKIAQGRPFFFGKKGKEVMQRYMYGVVSADWIDEFVDDKISTDRSSIDWNDPDVIPLRDWGRKNVATWITAYEKHRENELKKELHEIAVTLRKEKKANTYTPAENDQIESLVINATARMGKTKAAQKSREDLLIAISQAWINEPTRRLIKGLWKELADKKLNSDDFEIVLTKLTENSVPEAMGLALNFAQRAFALSQLHKLVHERSEVNLQKLVSKFPWILQPRGDLITADQWLKTSVEKAADAPTETSDRVSNVIRGMSEKERADFVFLTDTTKKNIHIVEIKGPLVSLNVEIERQLRDYMDFVQNFRSEAKVTGTLIGNKGVPAFVSNDMRIQVQSWDEVLLECRSAYIELLTSLMKRSDLSPDDSRASAIIDFGGAEVNELIEKFANDDPELKAIMEEVQATK